MGSKALHARPYGGRACHRRVNIEPEATGSSREALAFLLSSGAQKCFGVV